LSSLDPRLVRTLRYALFVLLGAGLLYLAFRQSSPAELWEVIQKADFRFILISMGMGFVAYIARGLRWLLLLDTLGYKARPWSSIHSVSIGYFANMAVPRAGEVARCTTLSGLEKIPVAKLFGTVIVERGIDLILLLSMLGLSFATSFANLRAFFDQALNGDQGASEGGGSLVRWIALGGIAFLALVFLLRKRIGSLAIFDKIRHLGREVGEGIGSVLRMPKKLLFVFYTLVIWGMYYGMVHVCIYALPETAQLSMADTLFVMVAAGMGMVVPVPGGVGAYHYLVVLSMGLLGIDSSVSLGFATLVHSGQAVMGIAAGLAALLYISLSKRRTPLPE